MHESATKPGPAPAACVRLHCLTMLLALLAAVLPVSPSRAERGLAARTVEAWTRAEGLPDNSITAFAETANGFLWIGTADGLARFDGTHIERSFPLRGMPLQTGISALQAIDDVLWIGTRSTGLWRLEPNRPARQWTRADGLPSSQITVLVRDGDALLVGTGRGAVRLQGGVAVAIPGLPARRIDAIARGADGTRWFLSQGENAYRQAADGGWQRHPLPGGAGLAAAIDDNGTAWLAAGDGLLEIARDGGQRLHRVEDGLASTLIRDLRIGADGSLWIAHDGAGVQRLRQGQWQGYGAARWLHHPFTTTLFEDSHRAMWVGTRAGAVRLRDTPIATYRRAHGLGADYVNSVAIDRDGAAWAGTDGGGVARIDPDGSITVIDRSDGLLTNTIRAVDVSDEGAVWIAAFGGGLQRLRDGRLDSWTTADGLPSSQITVLMSEPDGSLWIGSEDRGLAHFRDGRFERFDERDGLPSNHVRSLLRRADGDLLVGTDDRGIAFIEGGRVQRVLDNDTGLPCQRIYAMHEDSSGTLWVGSESGLLRVDAGSITNLASVDPVLSHAVRFVGDDGHGGLWVTGSRGVVHIPRAHLDGESPAAGVDDPHPLRRLGRSDGLQSLQVNGGTQPSAAVTADGRLWLPTPRGLAVVDPARLAEIPPLPRMQIESLHANGELLPIRNGTQVLPAGVNRVEIAYAGVQTLGMDRPLYQHRLEGLDERWITTSARSAGYAALEPGDYHFRVRAIAEHDGRISDEVSIAFTVMPYFYQQPLFQAGLAVFLIGLAAGGVRRRHRRLDAEKQRLAREVELRTTELRDALEHAQRLARSKATFLANMSHELRTPLSAIIGFTEHALQGDDQTARHALNRIDRHSRLLLELVNDVLDASRIDAGQLCVDLQPVSPMAVVEEVVHLLEDRAHHKGLQLRIEPRWPLPATVPSDPLRLKQVLLNLVANAIKFSESGTVRIHLEADAEAGAWSVAVIDEGIGISAEQTARLFKAFEQADTSITRRHGGSGLGLFISHQLVTLMGGTITVDSVPGNGTRFLVRLPLPEVERWIEAAEHAAVTPVPGMALPTLRGRVLLVEDSDDLRELLQAIIGSTGAQVVAVANGLDAVRQALAQPFDLILMDMHMPVLDGRSATRRLRESGYTGAIAAMTADVVADAMNQHREAGCDWVLTKPIDRRRLFNLLCLFLSPRAPDVQPEAPALDTLQAQLTIRFRQRLSAEADTLQAAQDDGRREELVERLHRLKGSCGMFGLLDVGEAAREAEQALHDGDAARFAQRLDTLLRLMRESAGRVSPPSKGASPTDNDRGARLP